MKCNNILCGKEEAKLFCSQCMVNVYCNVECQKIDWKNGKHNKLCKVLSSNCSICLDKVNDPITFSCAHVICKSCALCHACYKIDNECPICKCSNVIYLPEYVFNVATLLLMKASKCNDNIEYKLKLCNLARNELKRLEDNNNTMDHPVFKSMLTSTLVIKCIQLCYMDILYMESKYNECILLIESLLSKHTITINTTNTTNSNNKSVYSNNELINMNITLGNCYLEQNEYKLEYYEQAHELLLMSAHDTSTSNNIALYGMKKKLYFGLCVCYYEHAVYDKCIQIGFECIQYNTHIRVYTCITKSYIALHQNMVAIQWLQDVLVNKRAVSDNSDNKTAEITELELLLQCCESSS